MPVNQSVGIDVSFEWWTCALSARELRKWGSPHFDWKQVGQAVTDIFRSSGTVRQKGRLTFSRDLIAVANHAYPEAALVDPVADLELWEEWRQGLREFPYLGRYAPLGIFQQSGKTSSTSSLGVLGEVLAGRWAESLIAPTILVRVVRRWPDFILFARVDNARRFAFVESKAIGPDASIHNVLCGGNRIPDAQFVELGDQVVRQLNADPFIEVWGAFTFVQTISPMHAAFTLVQFTAADDKKAESKRTGIPEPVLARLAERCLGSAVADMNEGERADFFGSQKNSRFRKEVEHRLIAGAMDTFQGVINNELLDSVGVNDEEISPYLEQAIRRLPRELHLPGRRTRDARKATLESGGFTPIGSVGAQQIFMSNLPESDETKLTNEWSSDWSRAAAPWDVQNGVTMWRAGGAVYTVSDQDLSGVPVVPKQHPPAQPA